MGKAEVFQDLPLASPAAGKDLWRSLRDDLRAAILRGRLRRGARMPSTRSLARQYGCSRGTVVVAFDHLRSEGYLEARRGAGTFVALALPDDLLSVERPPLQSPRHSSRAALAKRAAIFESAAVLPASRSVGKAFRPWEPAIDLFPVELWSRIAGRVVRRAPRSLYGQGDPRGYLPLRKAIAEYVGTARGVHCSVDQIMVTSGAQQGLDLIARLLLDAGDAVWMEDPGYPGAAFAFRAAGARLIPVPVDGEGMRVDAAPARPRPVKLIYTTPANQFPLAVTLSLPRRLQLLRRAEAMSAWIVEDEFDAEYRYSGRPVPALQSLDRSGSVIYLGTFTKMLFNALRIGFLVLPERLLHAFTVARGYMDRHGPTLEQAILAEFILDGHFAHHIRRMRQVYAERLQVLLEASRHLLQGRLEVEAVDSGMRAVAWLRGGLSDRAMAARARARGLEVVALSQFAVRHTPPAALILGFAGCTPAELRRGVNVLEGMLRKPRRS